MSASARWTKPLVGGGTERYREVPRGTEAEVKRGTEAEWQRGTEVPERLLGLWFPPKTGLEPRESFGEARALGSEDPSKGIGRLPSELIGCESFTCNVS
jgi:hypothetical protein